MRRVNRGGWAKRKYEQVGCWQEQRRFRDLEQRRSAGEMKLSAEDGKEKGGQISMYKVQRRMVREFRAEKGWGTRKYWK